MNENELKELFERRNISEIRHAVDNHREIKERVLAWAVEHGNTELVHYVMNCTTQEEYERFENTPLESACLCGNYGMVKFIAENEKSPYFRRIIRFSMRLHTVTEELSAVLLKTVMTST